MTEPIRLGTRGSLLARTQSATVGDAITEATGLPWIEVRIRTAGDDTSTSLNRPGRPGLFVSALRRALIAGDVDVVVHSFKDLPSAPEPGITLAAVPVREEANDALVSRDGLQLDELPDGAVIGTSSPRRAARLRMLRPDLSIVPIRGNVDSRIQKVRDGQLDAVVLALAGLRRIGRQAEASQVLPFDVMLPAPAQGALAVECRTSDVDLVRALGAIDDPMARLATAAEREVLVGIDAACTTPVAAHARYADDCLRLTCQLWDDDGHAFASVHAVEQMAPDDLQAARAAGLMSASQLMLPGDLPRVLLVRADGNETDARALASHGIGAVIDPYLRIAPVEGEAPHELVHRLGSPADGPRMLVVSSPAAVPAWRAAVGDELLERAVAAAVAAGTTAVATGDRTASTLRELGFSHVDVPVDEPSAVGLLRLLAGRPAGEALFACGNLALRTIPEGLHELGWTVHEAVVYRTTTVEHIPASSRLVADDRIAAVVLRSPSAVRALAQHLGAAARLLPVVCAGRTTASAAREAGLMVAAVAPSPSPDAVAAATAAALNSGG